MIAMCQKARCGVGLGRVVGCSCSLCESKGTGVMGAAGPCAIMALITIRAV